MVVAWRHLPMVCVRVAYRFDTSKREIMAEIKKDVKRNDQTPKKEQFPRKDRAPRRDQAQDSEFAETVVKVRRVSKVITGGRRFSFSAMVVVGNRDGKVGVASGKSREVSSAIAKASKRAKANMIGRGRR